MGRTEPNAAELREMRRVARRVAVSTDSWPGRIRATIRVLWMAASSYSMTNE